MPLAPIATPPGVVTARRRIDAARLLLHGMLRAGDVSAIPQVRGQLVRAAAALDEQSRTPHPFAGAFIDGAAQANMGVSILGRALVQLRARIDGEITPADQPAIDAAMRAFEHALEYVEAARVWAYAGTHP